MKKRRYQKLRRFRKLRKYGLYICLPLFILLISVLGILHFKATHFRIGTVISGVNCSLLTVEKAEEKINKRFSEQTIHFVFPTETYATYGKNINLHLLNSSPLEEILIKQNNGDTTRNYELPEASFTLDSLKDTFSAINSLKEENMHKSTNAYLELTSSNFVEIRHEQNAYQIDIDKAYNLAYTNLRNGKTTIDFSNLITSEPAEICATDLIEQRDEINKILSTVVYYELLDGTVVTLDKSLMKEWLVKDENGIYSIDIDNNLPNFISKLSEKVTSVAPSVVSFNTTDMGKINVSIPKRNRTCVNSKKELERLRTDLLSGETLYRSPIYSKDLYFESYVEIDISRQKVWMYYNGKCIVETDCVTGTKGKYDTPTGLFYLTYKTEDDYLEGFNEDGTPYKSFVDYWMPFNGGIGLHDASWRYGNFGGNIYKNNGSHGCINLPLAAARTIYKYIDSSMPIIVYESK